MTLAVLPGNLRDLLEARLPGWIEAHWWNTPKELVALAPRAEIGWFDAHDKSAPLAAAQAAHNLRWLNTVYAGVDWMPLGELAARGTVLTNGSGLTASQVAEFAVMAMLAVAKDYRSVMQAQDRQEWLHPGLSQLRDLAGSCALILGHGAIGQAIERALKAFDVDVTAVSSHRPQNWRSRIGSFDWVVLALPGTPETAGIIGAPEIAALSPRAVLVNVARADCVDQDALVAALAQRRIAGAVLDLTDPEPLPPDHPLWDLPNVHVTMHLAGIPTRASLRRAAERFVANCSRFAAGEPLEAQVDLSRGY